MQEPPQEGAKRMNDSARWNIFTHPKYDPFAATKTKYLKFSNYQLYMYVFNSETGVPDQQNVHLAIFTKGRDEPARKRFRRAQSETYTTLTSQTRQVLEYLKLAETKPKDATNLRNMAETMYT